MKGFIQNIYGLRQLWNILETKFEFTCLCTNCICQDPLENEFAKVRSSCGCNDSPNAMQFGVAIKYNGVDRTIDHQENTNCKPDATFSLIENEIEDEDSVDPLALIGKGSLVDLPCEPFDFENIDIPDKHETNALVYVVGFVISKLPHDQCKNKFRTPSNSKHLNDESFIFTKLKYHLDSAKYTFPNEIALELGVTLLIAFKQKFYKYFNQHRCGVKTRLGRYIDYDDYADYACEECFKKFIDRLLNTFINAEIKKNQSKYNRRSRRNGKSRRMNIEESKRTKKTTTQALSRNRKRKYGGEMDNVNSKRKK